MLPDCRVQIKSHYDSKGASLSAAAAVTPAATVTTSVTVTTSAAVTAAVTVVATDAPAANNSFPLLLVSHSVVRGRDYCQKIEGGRATVTTVNSNTESVTAFLMEPPAGNMKTHNFTQQ